MLEPNKNAAQCVGIDPQNSTKRREMKLLQWVINVDSFSTAHLSSTETTPLQSNTKLDEKRVRSIDKWMRAEKQLTLFIYFRSTALSVRFCCDVFKSRETETRKKNVREKINWIPSKNLCASPTSPKLMVGVRARVLDILTFSHFRFSELYHQLSASHLAVMAFGWTSAHSP